jgi:hypothetical protein
MTGIVMVPLLLAACIFAREVRDSIARSDKTVSVEVSDNREIRGKLVRALDSGLIISANDAWTWIPKSEVRRVSEFKASKRKDGAAAQD